MGVIDQVIELLRQGKTVKGTIELPDSLVFWTLDYDGVCLKFGVPGQLDLGERIELRAPDDPEPGASPE